MKIIDVPKFILDLLAMADGEEDWGTPEPINQSLLPVPRFAADMLPDALRPWVEDIAHRRQCPIDYVAVAALVMVGSVIGTACSIRPKQKDNWTVVPNLWGAAIGRPSRRKSPAIAAAMKPLHLLDYEAREDHDAALLVHDQEKMMRKLKSDMTKKALAKQSTLPTDAEIKDLAALSRGQDDEPKCRRYFTNDCTFEVLGEILRDNPRGLLVHHDELMGLLDGFSRPGREGERPFYLTAWTGLDSHRVDRIGRGELYIPRLAASLFGGIQPEKLEEHMYSTGNDGFIQRFQLAVFPDDLPEFKVVDQRPDEAAEATVMSIVKMLAHTDFATVGAVVEKEGEIPYFRFEAKRAQSLFYKWLAAIDAMTRKQDATMMEEHLGKFSKLVPALALIFHLVDAAAAAAAGKKRRAGRTVGIASLKLALRWATYLEAHANRIYALGTDYRLQAVQALAKKIEGGELTDGFSDRDTYRKEWSGLRDLEEVKAACTELEMAGWIRRMTGEPKRHGRPASPKYEINPVLKSGTNGGGALTKPPKSRHRAKS